MRKQPEGGSVAPGRLANSLPCRQRAERVSSGRDALSSASAGPSSRRRGLLVEETGAKGVAHSRRLISASFGDWRPSTMRFAPPIRTRLSSVRGHVEGESRHAAVAARATYTHVLEIGERRETEAKLRAPETTCAAGTALSTPRARVGASEAARCGAERGRHVPLSRLSAERRRREPVAAPSSVAKGPPLAHACSRSRAARQKEEWRDLRPYAPSASLVPGRLAVARAGLFTKVCVCGLVWLLPENCYRVTSFWRR